MYRKNPLLAAGVLCAAALAVLLIGSVVSKQAPTEANARGIQLMPIGTADGRQEIQFALVVPDATHVSVLGDFNLWEATALSDADGDGVWRASMFLSPGRYEYAFVIDGRWWGQDPAADEYVHSFGGYSSVRYVGEGDGA